MTRQVACNRESSERRAVKTDTLVVFGSGGHSKVIVEAIRARTPDRAVTIIDDGPAANSRSVLGISVSGGRDLLSRDYVGASVALAVGDNRARSELMEWLSSNGYGLETVIHPHAVIGATVDVGAGAFVAAGALVIADARIGRGAIINTAASVDHDCDIGEAAHIAPGVHLCGNVNVGPRTLVGVGSCARPGITIAADVTIGAGSVIVAHITASGTFAGNPARPLR
jgi:sugar O-acyltransferase (sialic acid O-acetyltransferase NeuD family)